MPKRNKVESIIYQVTFIGKLVWIWPEDPNSKIFVRILKSFAWFLWSMSILPRTASLLCEVYYNANKSRVALVETLSTLSLNLEVLLLIFLWKYKENKQHALSFEIINYAQSLKNDEDDLFYKNLNSYLPACKCNAVLSGILMFCFCCGPLFLPNTLFPLPGWYPFSIDLYSPRYYTIYAFLVLEVFRVACLSAAFPLMYMVYFSYAITKVELLSLKLRMVDNEQKLNDCIEEHKECIRFVTQLNFTVRFILLAKYATTISLVIFTGLTIVLNRDFLSIFRSVLFALLSLMQVLFPTWFADELYSASQDIFQAVYDSEWTIFSTKMRKSMIIAMCRAQKDLTISVSGFIPALTKKFYASFLSLVLSYYMALRVLFK